MLRRALTGALIATASAAVVAGSAGSAAAEGHGDCRLVNGKVVCRSEGQGTGHQPNPPPAAPVAPVGQSVGGNYHAPVASGSGSVGRPSRPLTPDEQAVAILQGCAGQVGVVFCPGGQVGTPVGAAAAGGVPFMRNVVPARPGRPAAPAAPAAPPPPSPAQVAQIARAQLTIPKPKIGSAPCTAADCKGAVGVPVWLWTDPGMFTPTSQTATVGPVSVTVTAVATGVTWDMGDGQTVTCDGPGTKYDTAEYGWADSPDCGYKYTQTSTDQPGGRYPLTATATWAIIFSGDFAGTDTVATTSTTNVAIGEYQAIVKAG